MIYIDWFLVCLVIGCAELNGTLLCEQWIGEAVADFKVLSQNLPEETEENWEIC